MGAWGEGVLDNDTALDYIACVADRVVEDITAALSDDRAKQSGCEALAAIEVVTTLHCELGTAVIPEPQQIIDWARRWVACTSLEQWVNLPARLQEGEAVFRQLWDLAIEHHGVRGVSFEGDISVVPFVEHPMLPAPRPLLAAHS